jgi:hypothetical protein
MLTEVGYQAGWKHAVVKFYDVINDEREDAALPDPPVGSRLEALKAEFQAVIDRMDADTDSVN